MAVQKSSPAKTAKSTPAPAAQSNVIYSYNHQNPYGPFALDKIPKPLLILGGLMLFGSLFSFFTASTQSSGWASFFSTIVGLIDILLAIGLLLRLEVARKVIIYLSIVVIVLVSISGILVFQTFRYLDTLNVATSKKVAEIRQQPLSSTKEAQLRELEDVIIDTNRQTLLLKKRMGNVYIYWGFAILTHAGIAFYLTRTNIKSEFRKLQ